jgi:hypothetical protein
MAEEDKGGFRHGDDFESLYANNVQFESSVWDLKLLFGQLDQAKSGVEVEQHTAITLPWYQAKIAAYYFLVNVIINQEEQGRIALPARVVPPRPNPNAPEVSTSAKIAVEYLAWVHDQFFGSEPYIPPTVKMAQENLGATAPSDPAA